MLGSLLLAAAVTACGAPATKGNKAMTTPAEIAGGLQRYAPALFQGESNTIDQVELLLSDTPFQGLSVIAPDRVRSDAPLPLIIAAQKTVLRGWEVGEEANLSVVLVDLDSGEVQIRQVLRDSKAEERPSPQARRPPRPTPDAGKTLVTKVYRFDVRDLLDLPRHQGSIVLRALAFDWISNAARLDLDPTQPRLALKPPAIIPPPARVPGALPSYDAGPGNPKTPPRGVDFRIETGPGGALKVYGTFSRPATQSDLLPSPQALPTATGSKIAVAAVPMALALVGLDQRQPAIANWTAPVWGNAPVGTGSILSGHFALDLYASTAGKPPGQYAAWLFVGGEVYGPQRFEIK